MSRSIGYDLHRGVTFGFYARNGVLGSPWAVEQVAKMRALNIDWVVLTPIVMQDDFASTNQYRDFEITPDDGEVRRIIDHLHGAGIKVQLRPMLECKDGHGRTQIQFAYDSDGGRIPGMVSDRWARWFRSMALRSTHYARIAQETACEMYGLDSELDRMVGQQQGWKQVITAVRAVYDGPVTSCHTTHTNYIDFDKEFSYPDHWWRDLDCLGLSFYPAGSDGPGATVEDMVARLAPQRDRIRTWAKAYGKPLHFGEVGCTSSLGGARNPSGWSDRAKYDGEEQARYLEAVLTLFWDEPWWQGMYWWKWDEHLDRPHYRTDPAGDQGFTVDGKPAAEVMRRWFAKTR
jgi:hypothetical protein